MVFSISKLRQLAVSKREVTTVIFVVIFLIDILIVDISSNLDVVLLTVFAIGFFVSWKIPLNDIIKITFFLLIVMSFLVLVNLMAPAEKVAVCSYILLVYSLIKSYRIHDL